ncbi:MAG TPA: hypothetical protein PKY81_04630 [bacterium]|nr:hypothetical protein [bacterium]HPN30221.1 hypothetical protein [bacterium]
MTKVFVIIFFICVLTLPNCGDKESQNKFQIYNKKGFDNYFKIDSIEYLTGKPVSDYVDLNSSYNIFEMIIYHLISTQTGDYIDVQLYYFKDKFYKEQFFEIAVSEYKNLPTVKKKVFSENTAYYLFQDFCYVNSYDYASKIIFFKKTDLARHTAYNETLTQYLINDFFGIK